MKPALSRARFEGHGLLGALLRILCWFHDPVLDCRWFFGKRDEEGK